MAGLLTYSLYDAFPFHISQEQWQVCRKVKELTAAGTVAEFPDFYIEITAFPFKLFPRGEKKHHLRGKYKVNF
jgi:hypothetical protein